MVWTFTYTIILCVWIPREDEGGLVRARAPTCRGVLWPLTLALGPHASPEVYLWGYRDRSCGSWQFLHPPGRYLGLSLLVALPSLPRTTLSTGVSVYNRCQMAPCRNLAEPTSSAICPPARPLLALTPRYWHRLRHSYLHRLLPCSQRPLAANKQ